MGTFVALRSPIQTFYQRRASYLQLRDDYLTDIAFDRQVQLLMVNSDYLLFRILHLFSFLDKSIRPTFYFNSCFKRILNFLYFVCKKNL